MEASITLGRIRGIPIGIHSSWLIVFGLLTYSLADRIFPARFEGWTSTQYWITGAVASLLLFGSVVAHELGHAVVAQRRGIPVRRITLFIFGGVAELGQESETAEDEFWIAVAGPAVSVAIAVVSGVLWGISQAVNDQLAGITQYLASANTVLVVFNLIPAFPLDGGRVFRAFLWKTGGDMQRATRTAASVGMMIGFLFIAGGIFLVFQATFSGIWLVAMGWFLRSAAEQGYQQATLQPLFDGIHVDALMDREAPAISSTATIAELVDGYILGQNLHGVPVVDGTSVVGIITLTDIKSVPRDAWRHQTVRERMTSRDRLLTVSPRTPLDEAIRTMAQANVHQVPVVSNGALVGLLTRAAVIQFLQLRQALSISPGDGGMRAARSS